MFELKNIRFAYNENTRFSFPDMAFKNNEEWLVLGPSGCGKTTLLHLMSGLLKPTEGSVTLNQTDFNKLSVSKMDIFRGNHIGTVFQQSHFLSSLTTMDNLLFAQTLAGNKKDKQKATALLDRLGLENRKHYLPGKLSIGEQQRVSIARAVINQPKVILADEVLKLLREQASENNSVLIIVTHDTRLKSAVKNKIEL